MYILQISILALAFIMMLNPFIDNSAVNDDSQFDFPINGDLVIDYNQEYQVGSGGSNSHWGIDIGAEQGTVIKSADDGEVSFVGWTPAGEQTVAVVHENGIRTTYLNFEKVFVTVGQYVSKGQVLGVLGESRDPSSDLNHLHFGAIYHGEYIDPKLLMLLDIKDITELINLTEEFDHGEQQGEKISVRSDLDSWAFGYVNSNLSSGRGIANVFEEKYHWYWDGDVLYRESKEERASYFKDKKIVFISGLGSGSDKSSITGLRDRMVNQFELNEDQVYLFSYNYPDPEFSSRDTTQDLNDSADDLKRMLEDIRRETGMNEDEKFIIIAHSQGGQVIRQYMSNHTDSAERELDIVFSIASPNNGTIGATYAQKYHELGPGGEILFKAFFKATSDLTKSKWLDFGPFDPSILQMSENSELNKDGGFDVSDINIETVSISGAIDPVIVYPSAEIDGAENYSIFGGHLGACFSDDSLGIIEREVRGIEPVNLKNRFFMPLLGSIIGENIIDPAERTFFEFIYYLIR